MNAPPAGGERALVACDFLRLHRQSLHGRQVTPAPPLTPPTPSHLTSHTDAHRHQPTQSPTSCRHTQAYANNLNAALTLCPELRTKSLFQLVSSVGVQGGVADKCFTAVGATG